MHEQLEALQFYRIIKNALNSDGIGGVLVTLDEDNEMVADVVYERQVENICKDTETNILKPNVKKS